MCVFEKIIHSFSLNLICLKYQVFQKIENNWTQLEVFPQWVSMIVADGLELICSRNMRKSLHDSYLQQDSEA